MSKLLADCLNEIFEYLEEDKVTLYSCLLVNRLWCEVSVGILWRSIRNYNTLVACLPNESKKILNQNRIITSASTASNPPMFNYPSFCRVLSVFQVRYNIGQLLGRQQFVLSPNLSSIIMRELFKLLMNQISTLKKLQF